jgi:CelD/BcsL family acetyltransferase involved in cellulose biosynthesis
MAGAPQVVQFDESSRLDDLAREWLALAGRLEGTSYFQTPDWVLSWWETLAGRPRTRAAAWRGPSGRLEALVLLTRDRVTLHPRLPLRVAVYANAGSGVGAADHCGWLVPTAWREPVAAWLAETLGSTGLLLRGAPDADEPPLPPGARVIGRTACPRTAVPSAGDDVSRSHGFSRQLARFTRRMEREGVRFAWLSGDALDERVLRALFELHARSRSRHGDASSFGVEHLDLHRRLVARSGARRGPQAVVAERDGVVAGVLYGFAWKDTFAAYQWGWGAEWDRHSMGSVLAYQALRLAPERGIGTFDFLRGAEPYKYRFGAVDRWDRTWMVPRGLAGALLAARYGARDLVHGLRASRPAARRPAYSRS